MSSIEEQKFHRIKVYLKPAKKKITKTCAKKADNYIKVKGILMERGCSNSKI